MPTVIATVNSIIMLFPGSPTECWSLDSLRGFIQPEVTQFHRSVGRSVALSAEAVSGWRAGVNFIIIQHRTCLVRSVGWIVVGRSIAAPSVTLCVGCIMGRHDIGNSIIVEHDFWAGNGRGNR